MEVISKKLRMSRSDTHFRLHLPLNMIEKVGFKIGDKLRLIPKNDEIYLIKSDNNLGLTLGSKYNIKFPVRFNEKYRAKDEEYLHMWVEGKYIKFKFARDKNWR